MGRLGGDALVVLITELSPHLEKASAMLASIPIFDRKPIEMEPEERLAVYVRLRRMRKKMGLPEPVLEQEGDGAFDKGQADKSGTMDGKVDNLMEGIM